MTYQYGTATSTFTFDGGTIEAKAAETLITDNSYIAVNVTSNGGTIDAAGYAVSIERPIADASGESGAMTFKGGGSVTLKYANTYTGGTTIEAGTTLKLNTTAKSSIVANSIAVTIPEGGAAEGSAVLEITDGGTFSQAEVDAISISGSRYAFRLADNGAKVVIEDTQVGEYVWNDGASGASWKTAGKWSKNAVPGNWYDSTVAVFATDDDEVQVDSAVTAASIEFRGNATVNGSATLTVPTVSVAEGKDASIAGPTAGALEKTGAGTLTLGSSRTDATTLTEGTLVANAPVGTLTLGTDAAKPVTFDYGGQTYSTSYTLNDGLDVTLTNCTFSSFAGVANGTVHVAKDATGYINGWLTTGPGSELTDTAAVLDICGGVVSNASKNVSLGDHGELGATSEVRVRNGGLFTTDCKIIVGARAAATLTIDDGSVIVPEDVQFCQGAACKLKENCFVNLNAGGLLTARSITYGDGAANATFTFNGGTLKANQDYTLIENKPNMSVVTATSGTIDADGHAVTIAKTISGAGGMKYVGGGKVTYSVQPAYTGVTTVEVGTTLVVPEAIAGEKLAFTIPDGLAKGVYEVVRISGSSVFADSVLTDATKPVDASAQFWLNSAKTSIICVYGYAPGEVAYIGGSGGNLSNPDNWTTGVVPTSGEVKFDFAAATTLIVGDTFRADTITIPTSSAVVTIGEGNLRIAGSLTNACKLAIAQGASLTVDGDIVATYNGATFLYTNEGTVTVTSNAVFSAAQNNADIREYAVVTANTQPIKAGGLAYKRDGHRLYAKLQSASNSAGSWVVGANGLSFPDANASDISRFYIDGNANATLYSSADWTLANTGKNNTSNGDLEVCNGSSLTINTSDYDEPENTTKKHTVTLEGRIMADGPVTVTGCGTLEIATTGSHESLAEDYKHTYINSGVTLAVTDTATLKVNAGKAIKGAGTISLAAGTTLAVDASALGTIGDEGFTPCIPGLALPAEGTATIRIDGARLSSGDYVLLNAVPANYANLAVDCTTAAIADRKASVVEKNGQLVLNIPPTGLMVIFK